MAANPLPEPGPRIGRTHPNFRQDNGKLAELVAGMLLLHKCRPGCPCPSLQHLQVVARERRAHDEACRKYAANHPQKVRESRRNWRNRNLERERSRSRDYQRKWRAGEVGNYDHEAVKKKNREDIKAKRLADPEKFNKRRREQRAANHDKIVAKRREKEGQLPREEYLEIVQSAREVKTELERLRKAEQDAIKLREKADAADQLVQELRKKAWRPEDWEDWPEDERLVFTMMLEKPDLSPREIGIRLDESNFHCPYGKSWEKELTRPGAGATWIWRTRKRVKKAMQAMP